MNYNIKGTNIEISPELRRHTEKKLGRVERLLGRSAHQLGIELEFAKGDSTEKYRAEFTLACGRTIHRAEARKEALYLAIDAAASELTEDVLKTKKRNASRVRRGAARVKSFLQGLSRGARV